MLKALARARLVPSTIRAAHEVVPRPAPPHRRSLDHRRLCVCLKRVTARNLRTSRVVLEQGRARDPAVHDVVSAARGVGARRSWHAS